MRPIIRFARRLYPIAAALILSFLLSGCWTLSLHGLYTTDSIVDPGSLEPGIIGIWGDPDHMDEGSWQFLPAEGNSMRLIVREGHSSLVTDPVREGMFEVYLVRVGGQLILDLYPEEPDDVNEMFLAHVIPAHSFLRLQLEGHVMSLSTIDDSWLQKQLDQGRIEIEYQKTEGLLVLTADTQSLQALLESNQDELWAEDPQIMKRIQ